MANLVTSGSIKGHRCAQWKGKRREKGKTRDIEKTKRKKRGKKKNRVNKEQKKEYRKPKVMKNMSDRSKNMH